MGHTRGEAKASFARQRYLGNMVKKLIRWQSVELKILYTLIIYSCNV